MEQLALRFALPGFGAARRFLKRILVCAVDVGQSDQRYADLLRHLNSRAVKDRTVATRQPQDWLRVRARQIFPSWFSSMTSTALLPFT